LRTHSWPVAGVDQYAVDDPLRPHFLDIVVSFKAPRERRRLISRRSAPERKRVLFHGDLEV